MMFFFQIGNISCIVYDTDNMCMFGYITSDIDNLQVGTIYMKTYFT